MQWSISSTVCLCPTSREYNHQLLLIKYVSTYIANNYLHYDRWSAICKLNPSVTYILGGLLGCKRIVNV